MSGLQECCWAHNDPCEHLYTAFRHCIYHHKLLYHWLSVWSRWVVWKLSSWVDRGMYKELNYTMARTKLDRFHKFAIVIEYHPSSSVRSALRAKSKMCRFSFLSHAYILKSFEPDDRMYKAECFSALSCESQLITPAFQQSSPIHTRAHRTHMQTHYLSSLKGKK